MPAGLDGAAQVLADDGIGLLDAVQRAADCFADRQSRPLAIVGYGDEDESDGVTDGNRDAKTAGETP